jgi:hypothetical protein
VFIFDHMVKLWNLQLSFEEQTWQIYI